MEYVDVVGPDEGIGEWRLSAAADAVLADIADRAAENDARGIDRAQLDALAAVGLVGTALDPPARQREVAERIAMVDASVWFCWAQHQSPLRTLAAAEPADHAPLVDEIKARWLAGLSNGSNVGAVAFAHLRRPGPANPVAERVHGGWSITGTLDWVTSWDIADVMLLMVRGAGDYADSIICMYLAAGRDPATRPMTLDGVMIPDTNVAAVKNFHEWAEADAKKTLDANPATFGIVRGAVSELHAIAERRNDSQMRDLVATMRSKAIRLRRDVYAAVEAGGADQTRLAMRAESLDLAARAATAVITAKAGASMQRGCTAERRLREAMFLQVQAQTAATRHASLALIEGQM
ncbi:MAG: acyl-CoA dehydrogenase [Actinobacteria bacterium]|nr:acyl-CoA dehydrogenase [Actinomycetota bacterium]